MLKVFNCDLHIHTCLSPCADLDMHPRALVEKALEKNLDMIAISDHNASANVRYVMAAAAGKNIQIIPAMEITTSEEVHLLALFGSLTDLLKLQSVIDQHLFGENDETRFGVQAIVNELGEVEELNNQLLIGATDLAIDDTVGIIHQLGGLAIPAHIDRESFSVLSQLGFIDDNAHFDALEISKLTGIRQGRLQYHELNRYPFVTSSDAHFIRDIGTSTTKILMEQPSLTELIMAFSGARRPPHSGAEMLTLSDHILDITENSIRAGAKRIEICIDEDSENDLLTVEIQDDGHGMSPDAVQKVVDPFYTTKTVRRVGLGLPLLKDAAERSGGTFRLKSQENCGTTVKATFGLRHLDRQPLGAIINVIVILIISNSDIDFFYKHRHNDRRFEMDTREIRKEIEDVPINHPQIIKYIRGTMEEGLREIEPEA